jgi:hypothetical protein
VPDRRILRVLDIDEADGRCFVVNEWGSGTSLDILLAQGSPLSPTVAAWIVAEVGDSLAQAHDAGVTHGRMVPENVLIDHDGAVRVIGLAVDAALHGLPPGRISADVVDLVGLLYAGLTGKWAGVSRSVVPPAPSTHGHILRPRQVRAGMPRTLDSLCDYVLNHGGDVDVGAAVVADSLSDFLGTSAAAAEIWLSRIEHPQRSEGPVVLPPLPDPPARPPDEDDPVAATAGDAEDRADPAAHAHDEAALGADAVDDQRDGTTGPEPVADQEFATQAGLPIFHDDTDEVTWIAKRTEAAPPPPPLEPPPVRPLFAPDPEDGQPVRRTRVPANPADRGGVYWPWDTSTGTGATSATGSGIYAVPEDDEVESRPPGVSFLRLAAVIAVCLVVLLACVIAFNLGRGRTALGTHKNQTSPSTTSSSSPPARTPSAITGVTATDFDPQGSPPEENPTQAHLAVDGDPTTGWQTSRYDQNFGAGGLKTGVGLVLDLHAVHDVAQVDLTTTGSPTTIQVYVTEHAPSDLQGLSPVGRITLTGTQGIVRLGPGTRGRYVVVWLTSLPQVPGGYRGQVDQVAVKGD